MKYCSHCAAEVVLKVPGDDNNERWFCESCNTVHYQNPIPVVGCIPEQDGRILLCKRAIEPRYGCWTLPAGFMELGESIAEGAIRETREEACADVELGHLLAAVDVPGAGQLHLFFTATLLGNHSPGVESLETKLFAPAEIPWDELAFKSGVFALQKFLDDGGKNNGTHVHVIRR